MSNKKIKRDSVSLVPYTVRIFKQDQKYVYLPLDKFSADLIEREGIRQKYNELTNGISKRNQIGWWKNIVLALYYRET